MSTEYTPSPPIDFAALRSALPIGPLRHDPSAGHASDRTLVLTTDGRNYVLGWRNDDGTTAFVRYGRNDPQGVLAQLVATFRVQFAGDDGESYPA